jgi:hypothetical protein
MLALLALAGCQTQPIPATTAPAVTSSQAAVAALEASLAAAGRTIVACYSVPACSAAAPRAKIKAAYDGAYAALTTAQGVADAGGSPDLTAAGLALGTLQGLVAALPAAAQSSF